MEYYTVSKMMKITGLSKDSVMARFRSVYAKQRWGVEVITLPDGGIRRVVPESALGKWKLEKGFYVGRPTLS